MLEVRALYDKLNGKVCETQGRSLLVRARATAGQLLAGLGAMLTAARALAWCGSLNGAKVRYRAIEATKTPKQRGQDKSHKVRRGWGDDSSSYFNLIGQGVRRACTLPWRSSL